MPDPLAALDDYALIERAQAGDREAAGTLLLRHQAFVRKIAGKAMRYGRGRVDIEDLVQDGMLYLLQHLPNFDRSHGCKFLSYCARFLWARLYDRASMAGVITGPVLRNKKTRDGVPARVGFVEEETVLGEAVSPDGPETGADMDAAVEIKKLRSCLAMLDPRDRAVLVRRANGDTFLAIAETLGVSKARVGQIERAALRRLRQIYENANEL